MSNKRFKLFAILVITFLVCTPTYAIRNIHFGKYWDRESRSVIQEVIPFDAFWDDSRRCIIMNFNENVEEFVIVITNQFGNEIYSTTISSHKGESKEILLENLETGKYSIVVTDMYHQAKGEFQL